MRRPLVTMLLLLMSTACGDEDPSGDCDVCDAPAESDALFSFLSDGSYTGWERESAPHPSTGPHGDPVLVYLSPRLSSSLAASNASHDRGSAVVKEFLASDGTTVTGWAAWVKTADDSNEGNNIFWYETFDATSNDSPVADSFGPSGCTGCHAGGNDYLLIPYPLQ